MLLQLQRIFGNSQPVYSEDLPNREPVKTHGKESVDAKMKTVFNENMMPSHEKGGLFIIIDIYDSYIYFIAEINREKISILQQLGIGEYGPLLDAEVQLDVNIKSRALIKVEMQIILYFKYLFIIGFPKRNKSGPGDVQV